MYFPFKASSKRLSFSEYYGVADNNVLYRAILIPVVEIKLYVHTEMHILSLIYKKNFDTF